MQSFCLDIHRAIYRPCAHAGNVPVGRIRWPPGPAMTGPVSSAASACCSGAPTPQPLRPDLMPASRRAWSDGRGVGGAGYPAQSDPRCRPSTTGRRGIGRRCAICCSGRAMTTWRPCAGEGRQEGASGGTRGVRRGAKEGMAAAGLALLQGRGVPAGHDARNPRTRLPRTGNPAPLALAGGPGRAGRAVIRRAVTRAAAEPCRAENRHVPIRQ